VYLQYEAGATWGQNGDDTPGEPHFFMHQLGGLAPNDLVLDKDIFARQMRKRMPECPNGVVEVVVE
jgi:hypothetical protein